MEIYYIVIICFLIIIIFFISIKHKNKIRNLSNNFNYIAGITATHTIFNVKVPGTKNIIDMVTIHPSGIYLINEIQHEGHISGTIGMDYWEIDTPENKTYKIKNPIKEMRENEAIIKTMLNENIYPVIIFRKKTSCHVLNGWINENLILIKEQEQECIFKDKKYIISYIRAEDIFENMKQFQSRKKRSDK